MSFKDNFYQFVEKQVEDTLELMFANAHGFAMTTSGDITPEQQFHLDELKENLKELIAAQTLQNLTDDQKKKYELDVQEESDEEKEWVVPVCRTGFGSRTIRVMARTEQEAIDLAKDEAGNHEFSENDADYSAPDGAHPA